MCLLQEYPKPVLIFVADVSGMNLFSKTKQWLAFLVLNALLHRALDIFLYVSFETTDFEKYIYELILLSS